MKLAIGGDHAGFEYKKQLVEFLKKEGHEVKDFGPDTDASVDYPDHVHPLSEAVEKGEYELGILICGSANGVAMTANKHQGIRAGIAWEDELAALTRQHNNANIICIPARFIDYDKTQSIVNTFLNTEFEGGRHGRRVDKISC
ncbi:ribose 5-phosphate isomerase B [Marivirga sericea]|uniref:Ribose 5-phosphate isomerase B n=1 Tax=Marivirga sericea TaxID=1028 RepID=A0A1X7J4I0_9BACT|nr:ribose 5-phosphate isomerase B [Marivirga sericea]SMG21769.1 ribose 5-phosphate isomerase B [Marivirga sericea]